MNEKQKALLILLPISLVVGPIAFLCGLMIHAWKMGFEWANVIGNRAVGIKHPYDEEKKK
jgi:hypothetical protein